MKIFCDEFAGGEIFEKGILVVDVVVEIIEFVFLKLQKKKNCANVWEKKYKDAISAVYRLKRAKPIKSRRWV